MYQSKLNGLTLSEDFKLANELREAFIPRGSKHRMDLIQLICETMITVITVVHDCSEGVNKQINLGQK